jgi:PAS domain S-box-containing protein
MAGGHAEMAEGARVTLPDTPARSKGSRRYLVAVAVVAVAVTVAGVLLGFAYYQGQRTLIQRQVQDNLVSVAKLKAGEIVRWRQAALSQAEYFDARKVGRVDVPPWLNGTDPAAAGRVRQLLADNVKYRGFTRVVIYDPMTGKSMSSDGTTGSAHEITAAKDALEASAAAIQEPYLSGAKPLIDVTTPVTYADGARVGVVMTLDPIAFLYPFIQTWPTPSDTAETLLVRAEGDRVVYLNDLRFRRGAALVLTYPTTGKSLLAVQAVAGRTGAISGTDYRGQRVLGAVEPILGSDWVLVAKMDESEAYAPARQAAGVAAAGVAALLLVLAAGLVAAWRIQVAGTLRERAALAERYAFLSRNVNDAVLLVGPDRIVRDANERAVEMYGYAREELLGLPLADLRTEGAKAAMEDDLARLGDQGGAALFETKHVRKDGEVLPVEVSARVQRLAEGDAFTMIIRDVTERLEAEKTLRESEDKFRYVFSHSSVPKSITRPSGEIDVNDAFLAMLGYTREEIAEHGTWQQVSHPDDVESTNAVVASLIAGERDSARFEKRYLRKDGSVVWADVSTALRRDESGQPDYFMTTIVDITDRRIAEQALRESEEKYRGLFANAQVGMFRSRLDGSAILAVNPKLCEIFGYSEAEMLSNPATIRWADPEARAAMIEELQTAGKLGDYEIDILNSRGETRTCMVSLELHVEQGYLEGSATDITDRMMAEAQLSALSARHEAILQAVPDIIAEVDVNKVYSWTNEAGRRFFGEDVIGHEAADYFLGEQDTYLKVEPLFHDSAEEAYVESWQRRADGERRLLAWWCRSLTDENGVHVGALSTARDITRQRAAEDELTGYRQHLEALVEDRTEELNSANEELTATNEELTSLNEEMAATNEELAAVNEELANTSEELGSVNEELQVTNDALTAASTAKSEFLANMSHELRTPLNSIIGFSGVMLQGLTGELTSEQSNQLVMIRHSGERLLALISDILDLSRIESGRALVKPGDVDLCELVASAIETVQPMANEHGLRLELIAVPPGLHLITDEQKVHQVLVNLLANAVKFTDNGSVSLEVTTPSEATVVLKVLDTGVGIAPEDLSEIFGEFIQIPRQGAKPEGTGLGLAISRRLAVMLGGTLTASSVEGKGSTFTLVLPRAYGGAPGPGGSGG